MNTTTKSDYLLLFRGNVWDRGLSPAQLQKVVSDWMAWFERLKAEGKCAGGHPLEDEGKVVFGKQRTVAGGPFAESKEAIGGYFYLTVADENEAIEIAQQCPGLEYGAVVEVRLANVVPRTHPHAVVDRDGNDGRVGEDETDGERLRQIQRRHDLRPSFAVVAESVHPDHGRIRAGRCFDFNGVEKIRCHADAHQER